MALLLALGSLVVTALSVKLLAGPLFMFQFGAVVGASLYGGLGPGLLAMVLSGAGFHAMFYPARLEPYQLYRLVSFVLVSVFFAWAAAGVRHARAAAEAARARAEAAEAEARLFGAQQERLVAVVSHDLRNPLNAVTITAEHLMQLGNLSERQARGVSRIVTSARRMQSMIRDLLDFARARSGGGLPVRLEEAQLGEVCRSALEEVRSAHPRASLVLDVAGDDRARLDPARIEQVVCNLVTNALKHGVGDSPVEVRVTDDDVAVQLEVTNHGAPIPEALLLTLFEPFRTGDAAGSIGLGLFIVREIARAHGGGVFVRSGEHGTTFTVAFPKGRVAVEASASVA